MRKFRPFARLSPSHISPCPFHLFYFSPSFVLHPIPSSLSLTLTWFTYRPVSSKHMLVIYRVSQEECTKLREGVPYVNVYRYNPKHLCPKLNGYGDNDQRKVWSSGGSTHCTCHCTSLIVAPFLCMVSNYGNSAHDSPELHMTSLQLDNAVHAAAGL